MIKLHEQYIIDGKGTKSAVVLPIEDYRKLMKIVEEFEDTQDFDRRMKDTEWISIDDLKKDYELKGTDREIILYEKCMKT